MVIHLRAQLLQQRLCFIFKFTIIFNDFQIETYVKNEFLYHRITRKGNFDDDQLGNWTAYLEQFRSFIEKGFQFTRLAVQEPYGVMILQVNSIIHTYKRKS